MRASEVPTMSVEALIPYARNSRTHSEDQVAQIAASIGEFGFTNPVLVDGKGVIIAGHGRVMAAKVLGLAEVPVLVLDHLTDTQRRAYVIADNKLALNAGWDEAALQAEIAALTAVEFDTDILGFNADELAALLTPQPSSTADPDKSPELPAIPISEPGDVWLMAGHRIMCGDSTSPTDVARLMAGVQAQLLHADPPYGMGKQADGVLNDNLYREKLDQFQMAWWRTFRPHVVDTGSAYIWGNAPDLWRLWHLGGLADSERFEFRNQIVWDKKSIAGMASPGLTQYPEASEHCLFFQFGSQFLGNINADDYPEAWEEVRGYLAAEAETAGIKAPDIKRICGCGMFGHWFTKSQFTLIPEKHYAKLQRSYPGRFSKPWAELRADWNRVKGTGRAVINGKLEGMRSYFDNSHDVMRDVWEFPRVTGNDRHGHATPKPVAMMERIAKSSCPPGGVIVEPFGGSGSTTMGAEVAGRRCFSMELHPAYVDVAVRRWEEFTGKTATLEATGQTFQEVQDERRRQTAA